MASRNVLNHGKERPAISFAAMVLLEFPPQGNGLGVLIGIDKLPDQVGNLLHPRRIFLEQLPQQWFGFGQTIGGQKSLCIRIA